MQKFNSLKYIQSEAKKDNIFGVFDFENNSLPNNTVNPERRQLRTSNLEGKPSKEYTTMNNKNLFENRIKKNLNKENTFKTLFGEDGCKGDGLNFGKKKNCNGTHQKSSTINNLIVYDNTPIGYDKGIVKLVLISCGNAPDNVPLKEKI